MRRRRSWNASEIVEQLPILTKVDPQTGHPETLFVDALPTAAYADLMSDHVVIVLISTNALKWDVVPMNSPTSPANVLPWSHCAGDPKGCSPMSRLYFAVGHD